MPSGSSKTIAILVLVTLNGCGPRRPGGGDDGTCDLNAPDCPEGLVCDAGLDGDARCAVPVRLRGTVQDIADDTPVAGALVQAVDVNGAVVGTSVETDGNGTFMLVVPALRDADGVPVEGSYTLRVQAASYQEFPTAIRPALPLDASTAVVGDEGWMIENALTTVKLIALPGDSASLGSISGIVQAQTIQSTLVVAEGGGAALTGFSDSEGRYVIFNVPAGSYTVRGYAAGLQFHPQTTSLQAGETQTGVDLAESDAQLSTVSGTVQIVNAPGGSVTSVVLAVESTFVEGPNRGKAPPGLRVGEVTGQFSFASVPDGRYVVLAAFENDGLVRDPDQTIGGTQIVRIEVPDPEMGNTVTLPEGFKVTGALAVTAPGADGPQEVLTTAPLLEWEDDSSEDGYELRVFDAFGAELWSDEIGSASGTATVTHTYGGPPLEAGMFYQFRATSFRDQGGARTAISSTEDLTGVFFYCICLAYQCVKLQASVGR